MVELALSTVLFVVIIAGGIHFAELGMIAVKASEASTAALYDATGRLPHEYGNDELQVRHAQVVNQVRDRIGAQYENFDGLDRLTTPSPTMVYTRAGELNVDCSRANDDIFPALDLGELNERYVPREAHNGIRCSASATASIIPGATPQSFHEDPGWLRGPILKSAEITFCGVGRAWAGDCNRGTPILLGEWGLMDPSDEGNECDVYDEGNCDNPGYYNAAKKYFETSGVGNRGRAGSNLASAVAMRSSPIDEDKFWMSFKGAESKFQQELKSTHFGDRETFAVSPGGKEYESLNHYERVYNERSDCWLGLPCQ